MAATAATEMKNDPRASAFALFTNGVKDVGAGKELSDKGRAGVVVGMVMAAQAIHADTDEYRMMIRAAAGLHADAKEQQAAYSAAWGYWRNVIDLAGIKSKHDQLRIDRVTAEDSPNTDNTDRARTNASVNARTQAIMFAASVLVQFDHAKVNWNEVKLGKRGDSIVTDEENMRRLFANLKKDKSIEQWELPHYPIATYGNFRFTALAEEGANVLRARGVKKSATRKSADTSAMRDKLADVAKVIVEADAKSYDAPASENKALAAFISIATALNDGTLKGARLNNTMFTAIDWIVQAVQSQEKGEEMPEHARRLLKFVSDMLDKNVSHENKGKEAA